MRISVAPFALLIAALSLVVPASAQDPVDSNGDAAPAKADEPTDSTGLESGLEEPDTEDLEETRRMDVVQQDSFIEKILITGEKQNTLQGTPTSSTSFSAGDLQALRIQNISDLADFTPNLEINTVFAASNPTIFIRGIGLKDYNAIAAGAVAIYQDGVNINSPAIQLGQLFDVEGIDVLRGPQGSVNGRNATAGAIMIRSAMPDGEFGVSTSLTYGNYDDKEVEAAINIPLIKDILSMRVSGTAHWRDGYTKNQCAGWDPTVFGKPRIDEKSTRVLYESLQPAGQWENGEIRAVDLERLDIRNGNTSPESPGFVFLNFDEAETAKDFAAGIFTGSRNKKHILAEDLYDSDGALVAPTGTVVAVMGPWLTLTGIDEICIVEPPGRLFTLEAEARKPERKAGLWGASRVQPGLEDFAGLKRWTNNIDNWAARMVLLFEPLDNMEWMVNVHGTQNRGDSAHLQMLGATSSFRTSGFTERLQSGFSEDNAARNSGWRLGEGSRNVPGVINAHNPGQGGGNPHSGFYSSDGTEFIDAWGVNGKGFLDLGFAIVTLLYDYEWYDRVVEEEGDANPLIIFPRIWSDSAWQTTEELRIEGEGERYKWAGGFFFLHEDLDASNLFPAIRQYRIEQKFEQTLTSWAPYLSGEVDLVEEGVVPGIFGLTLGAGVRYNQEKKEFSLVSSVVGTTSNVEVVVLPKDTVEETWKEWTGDVQLSYTPFANEYGSLRSYLKYGHGFKGGHFNGSLKRPSDPVQDIEPAEPEFIDAVEFGIQSRWFDDRVSLNAAVFRYWYQDLQVLDVTNDYARLPTEKVLNGDADVRGAEAELHAKPVPGLLISANMGWLDSEFNDFVVPKYPNSVNYAGNRLVAAPKWNFGVIIKYEVPLFGWGSLTPQWNFNWRSKVYFDPQMLDPISQDAYGLHNARLAYRTPGDRIELAFWISNIFDEEYKIDAFDLTREFNTIREVWGEPRTYGVTLSLNW
jgi:iron complex outermembrane receptor protein